MGTAHQLRNIVTSLLSSSPNWNPTLLDQVPCKWVIHGNCVLVPPTAFTSHIWKEDPLVLREIASILKVATIARQSGPIHNPSFRQPSPVDILYPPTESSSDATNVTVRKKENGIYYEWDLTKVMFSRGNISEKQRLAQLDLRNSVVVDLFAGIGYFTLTFLVHSRAAFVYACEWNPDAIYWLENNLKLNKIHPERYAILDGDNKIMAPRGVADHVNLGLIPSSEGSWEAGVAALRRDTGGVLHVHGNVDLHKKSAAKKCDLQDNAYNVYENQSCGKPKCWQIWGDYVKNKMTQILKDLYPEEAWLVGVAGIFKVKSYGPRVDHLVVDIIWRMGSETFLIQGA